MKARQALQALAASFRQPHLDPAPVAAAYAAADESRRLAPRDQRHHPVLLCLQALGEFAYGRPFPAGKAPDLKQEQVLQRGYSLSMRDLLAEAEETAQLIAKMGKPFIFAFCQAAGCFCLRIFHHFQYIIL